MAKTITQKASSLLRTLGLGFAPDIAAKSFENPVFGSKEKKAKIKALVDLGVIKNPFISPEEKAVQTKQGPVQTIARDVAGVGSWAVPFGKGLSLAKLLPRAATSGGLAALSQPNTGVGSTATGGITSMLLAGTLRGGSNLVGKAIGKPERYVKQLFNAAEPIRKFEGKTGKKFTEEFTKRDLPNIAGKGIDEINDYFQQAYAKTEGSADDFLRQSGKIAKQKEILDIIDDEIAKLSPVKGRVLQSGGVAKLQELRNEVLTGGKEFTLDIVNQFKRDAQSEGRAAFGPSGSSSAASNALGNVQKRLNDFLEKRAPGIKDINKTIQYYNVAKEAISKRASKPSRLGLADILGGGGALTAGVFGGPVTAGVVAAPFVGRHLTQMSQFQTKAAQLAPQITGGSIPDALKRTLFRGAGQVAGGLLSGERQTDQVPTNLPFLKSTQSTQEPAQPQSIQAQQPQSQVTSQQDYDPQTGEGYKSPDGQWVWSAKANDWVPNPEAQQAQTEQYTPESLTQMALELSFQGRTKEADQLLQVASSMRQNAPTKNKPLSGPNAVLFNKAETGVKAIDRIDTALKNNPNVLISKKINPLDQGGRGIGKDIASAIDILGYFRTGAAITREQRADYIYMFPNVLDSKTVRDEKIRVLREELQGYKDLIDKSRGANDIIPTTNVTGY